MNEKTENDAVNEDASSNKTAQSPIREDMEAQSGQIHSQIHELYEEAAPIDTSSEVIAQLEQQNKELKDSALRLAADMENLRRRTTREIADAKAYSVANFARDMLAVGDNLGRTLAAIPQENRDEGSPVLLSLIEGVEMTARGMHSTMERHGIKKLSPDGEKFDPNFHQAMFEVPNPEVPNNTVVQVVQEGYTIGARVLRPAMVGVAKGGPKQAPTPQAPTPQEGE